MESLKNKLIGKPYIYITYIAQDKHNLAHLLLQEASDFSRVKEVSGVDLEFWKLAVSSTINLMNPIFETRLSKLFTGQQLDTMKEHMNDQKTTFQNIEISELIDSLFDSLLHYQLDPDTGGVIDVIDVSYFNRKILGFSLPFAAFETHFAPFVL
ncbi:hypothetical protein BC941DRAFT_436387 [Chlamydoabsidia padenii]|nr:hypothetical protein BC941DRAFT_436387 [Chlamydoabsidia padenii]